MSLQGSSARSNSQVQEHQRVPARGDNSCFAYNEHEIQNEWAASKKKDAKLETLTRDLYHWKLLVDEKQVVVIELRFVRVINSLKGGRVGRDER